MIDGYSYAGIGVHIGNLNQAELRTYPKVRLLLCSSNPFLLGLTDYCVQQQIVLAVSVIYILCIACAELALLMFYYALLNVMRFWKYVIYVVSGIIAAYTFVIFFVFIFSCRPIERTLPQSSHMDHCIHRASLYLATAVANTMIGIILILIPIRVIWRLHVPVRQKLGVAAIFGVGCM